MKVQYKMCIRDRYDKIQTEKELAEEDAIQAQQPAVEEETPKPNLREQFEQYKPCLLYTSP